MQRIMCKSKICGLTITHKNLKYEGSIEIPEDIRESADILPGEFVLVVNECNGARFNTYVIKGEPCKCGLVGGAARLGEIGDKLIIMSYELMSTEEAKFHNTKVVEVDERNNLMSKSVALKVSKFRTRPRVDERFFT